LLAARRENVSNDPNARPRRERIVFFDFAVALGGSITVMQNTLRALDTTRYEAFLFTALPDPLAAEAFAGLDVTILTHHHIANYVARFSFIERPEFRAPWKKRLASYLFTVYSALVNWVPFVRLLFRVWRLKPDLMHTHNGIDSMLVAGLLKIPAVLHLHGPFGMDSRFEIALAKRARTCLCVSQGIADMLIERGVRRDAVVVLPNPAPIPATDPGAVEAYRKRFAVTDDAVVFVHVGRLVRWKGQLDFLRAFANVARQMPNVVAVIVGSDAENLNRDYVAQLRSFVTSEGLDARVIFTGHVRDVPNLMLAADVVVHSSIEPEPFGLVVTEAMALKRPVIAASFGATADIVDDGLTGVLVDPRNEPEFAGAILQLAQDPERRRSQGAAGFDKLLREYSIERYMATLEKVYQDALCAGGAAPGFR
jgi:glycosyltransferase involved in cell wall biosynthesis